MKKNIGWLKREIHKELEAWYGVEGGIDGDGINEIMLLINQLDEPEVLSQDWIDEHEIYYNHWVGAVPVTELQNLLVPKQELPVIPKFVAGYLDYAKSDTTLMRVLELANTRNEWEKWEKEYDWIEENHELFARAWLDGFTVEREQKYYVINNDNRMMLVRMVDGKTITEADPFPFVELYEGERKSHRLTEQEIKDYDERYWPFAVKVEELEE